MAVQRRTVSSARQEWRKPSNSGHVILIFTVRAYNAAFFYNQKAEKGKTPSKKILNVSTDCVANDRWATKFSPKATATTLAAQ
ncbi:hypothetical protein [Pseudomonas silesiensis]|jgi:hypothetical protein|uniref:hypothetical protein n=1 Tax=Pseudomonas silesiensis TaxID=1853130 RepID=UPI0012602D64|nr:hypothetical protein [Pseudomonas silesiensis]